MNQFTDAAETVTLESSFAPPPRSTTVGLVPFLFGVAGAEELPGAALVRLLGQLGLSTAAARGLLARMRRQGQLASARHGRTVRYRLAGQFAVTFRRLRDADRTPPPHWKGHFHALLYQVSETERAYRDRLRHIALVLGYGVMQPGVLIAIRDLTGDMAEVLAECPPECRVQVATIGLSTADAAAIAWRAWGLESVRDCLRRHIAAISAELQAHQQPPANAESLRRLAQLLNPPHVDLIRDPNLPTELLPADWPGSQLRMLLGKACAIYLPPLKRHVHSVIEDSR